MTSRCLVAVFVIAVVTVLTVRLLLGDLGRAQWIVCGIVALGIVVLRTMWLLLAMRKRRETMRYVRSAFL